MERDADGAPREWREGRRLRALELHEAGWIGERIAEALGVTAGAVSHWLARARTGGRDALRTKPPPGPTPKLTATQRTEAQSAAWRAERWPALEAKPAPKTARASS